MSTSRRNFVKLGAAAGGALSLGIRPGAAQGAAAGERAVGTSPVAKAPRSLKVLIFGGTGFIGPHTVDYALARGHQVSVFSRGQREAELPAQVEHLIGDRNGDYSALAGRTFDLVIDNHTMLPRWITLAAEALKGRVGHYAFISTIGVAKDFAGRIHEDEPVADWTFEGDPLTLTEMQGAMYGPLKAVAEREVRRQWGDDAVIVRPGLIVGPYDSTDRWTYWVTRFERGGEILAPGNPTDPTQLIDARDLMGFTVRKAEEGDSGLYLATGPGTHLGMAEMLGGIRALTDVPSKLTWVAADFLEQHDLHGYANIPSWVPPEGRPFSSLFEADVSRAVAAGLTFRPLAETVRDTLAWWNGLPAERRANPRAGIPAAKEAEVLAAWKASGRAAG